ncbi:senescence-associated protein-domain-containing protein [Hypoxylon trugodes]|uniref:senescence-associated protein-domain-containing protein n=1 Tax=Hypoxylon trugodes TaxID=326681 RepID=UPI00219FE587|nr:senescence-associated protein-domain-containing protein [Hypoxylon trugodes]KAI1386298.1 senescence-associated protein-domain-containing protein [Hypoxylon trugodes]
MASGHNDPRLLYAISGVSAYHLAYGKEESLTPAGPQTLSLLMVPTSSPYADPAIENQDGAPPEDFYLHLHLPPELDIPLPATTQIYHQPPTSYLIPRWDLGPDSGAFTRIEFPAVGARKGLQEDVDTFETILAQCTAFLERAPPPKTARREKEKKKEKSTSPTSPSSTRTSPKMSKSKSASPEQLPAYNPASYKPGEGYVKGSQSSQRGGQIVLVDEEDGSVIGELSEGYQVLDSDVKPGSKDPVEITLPDEGTNKLAVVPASPETLELELHPAYQRSFIVSKAAYASRLIITTSDLVSNAMQSGSESFVKNTKSNDKAVTFTPATHDRVRRIGKFSGGVADLSSKTVGQVTKLAQNVGATIAGRGVKEGKKGYGPDGQPLESFKPGLLNKSLMAFTTVADGIDQATRNLLTSASSNATSMVTHRWGAEAGELSKHLGGSVKNVGLVYIDVTGVSRKAVIKAVGKGMVVGKVKGGGEIIVGDDTSDIVSRKETNGSKAKSTPASPSTNSPVDGKGLKR